MTLILLDLDKVRLNQHAKYLGQRSVTASVALLHWLVLNAMMDN